MHRASSSASHARDDLTEVVGVGVGCLCPVLDRAAAGGAFAFHRRGLAEVVIQKKGMGWSDVNEKKKWQKKSSVLKTYSSMCAFCVYTRCYVLLLSSALSLQRVSQPVVLKVTVIFVAAE